MATPSTVPTLDADSGAVARLWDRARAGRWELGPVPFAAALRRSVAHRFGDRLPSDADVEHFLGSLHLEDLALACACARGHESAWEHFVREYRPILLRIAGRGQPPDRAREVADSIYADLYGLEERGGARRSLFDYFHGRSSLAGWLKAVVAQRLVDKARAARRLEPLPESGEPANGKGEPAAFELDPDRVRFLQPVRRALGEALAALAARDRLRLALYYAQDMTLAAVGRTLGESEATSSRKLDRTRTELRTAVERRLREIDGFSDDQIAEGFEYVRTDPAFDLARALPPGGG